MVATLPPIGAGPPLASAASLLESAACSDNDDDDDDDDGDGIGIGSPFTTDLCLISPLNPLTCERLHSLMSDSKS